MRLPTTNNYEPIANYALLSNCRSTALVSRTGSIDWCCMPRMDADSCFSRLLDAQRGGYCSIAPAIATQSTRAYENSTLILKTTFADDEGHVDIYDFFRYGDIAADNESELIRLIVGVEGSIKLKIDVLPRFDYGETIAQVVQRNPQCHVAFGSNSALLINSAFAFTQPDRHALSASIKVTAGERLFVSLRSISPQNINNEFDNIDQQQVDAAFTQAVTAWRQWLEPIGESYRNDAEIIHSALILKALTYAPTGAIIGAPTTSLPETIGGKRNWDYRYCWIRDSVYAAEILFELGLKNEANQLRIFIERSSAGSAEQIQTLYALDGGRRLTEFELDELTGYKNSAPVRIGNGAAEQQQWDMYGELLQLASLWYQGEHEPDADYWAFLVDVLDHVCQRWHQPDRGIWEFRDSSRHLVHSKTCCWSALDRGITLAKKLNYKAPLKRWINSRDAIREAIDAHGFDRKRGVFRQAFDSDYLDAAILRLPRLGYIAADDTRMLGSIEVICRELDADGLLRRYNSDDGLEGDEGVFLPCTFWLVTCLALQRKCTEAYVYYRRAMRCANELGLLSEEYDLKNNLMLGNFPQALTHSSQIVAKMALLKAKYER